MSVPRKALPAVSGLHDEEVLVRSEPHILHLFADYFLEIILFWLTSAILGTQASGGRGSGR